MFVITRCEVSDILSWLLGLQLTAYSEVDGDGCGCGLGCECRCGVCICLCVCVCPRSCSCVHALRYLATTSADKTVKIWNVEKNFTLDKTLSGHQAWVWDCSFSADSAYLVTASSDKTAKLWDLKTGEVILEYKGHHKAVTSVALNDSSWNTSHHIF